MPRSRILVQPPSRVQVDKPLNPPIIVRTTIRQTHTESGYFAMAVLIGSNGTVVDGCLNGNYVVSGILMDETSSSSKSSLVFIFPDLRISSAGTYTIRLDLYKPDHTNGSGMAWFDHVETTNISVVNREVSYRRPCKLAPGILYSLTYRFGQLLPSVHSCNRFAMVVSCCRRHLPKKNVKIGVMSGSGLS